jgi:hypothetical protein
VSEWRQTVRDAVAALAAADPARRRFGATRHRYALAPPLTEAAVATVEARLGAALPDEVRGFATGVAAGGAGPGHGVVPIDRAAGFVIAGPARAPWRRGLPVADLGCGYAAVVALDGRARGEVWIDARAIGVLAPTHASFTALYLDWIDRLAHARWPDAYVPPGACALAAALSGYLAHCEAEAGVTPGTLAGPELARALSALGPGAIEVAAESTVAWFDDRDRVDPCIACARLLDNLAASGLGPGVVAPGVAPRPAR